MDNQRFFDKQKDLIEPYWNVKYVKTPPVVSNLVDLIEPYWNVKILYLFGVSSTDVDLIEPYWNVKCE